MAKQRMKKKRLTVACWNMRSLVQNEGSIETATTRPGARGVAVNRKADLMVQELKRYQISITGISETKCFGQEVYNIGGYTVLHSGRPLPGQGEREIRAK